MYNQVITLPTKVKTLYGFRKPNIKKRLFMKGSTLRDTHHLKHGTAVVNQNKVAVTRHPGSHQRSKETGSRNGRPLLRQ